MRRVVGLVVGVALVAGTLTAAGLARSNGGGYEITADFDQAPNLFEGGRVTVRGVAVGRISRVEPRPGEVRVTLALDPGVKVPASAHAVVVPITIIADRYVQLEPAYAGGPQMAGGDHIPLGRTAIPAELDDVLTQLRGLLGALEPEPGEERGPLADFVVGLDDALEGRSEELSGALAGSAEVLGNLARSEEEIAALIRNLDRFFLAVANRASEMGLLNERFEVVAEALLTDQANLQATIRNLGFLSEQGAGLVSESGEELGRSFGRLQRVLDAVLAHDDSLRRGFAWTNVIAQGLGATDGSGRGRFAYTGRQAAPGTPGAAYNYRIDSRDTVACRRINRVVDALLTVTPGATPEDHRESVLVHIPRPTHDEITFLIDLLIPLCVEQLRTTALDESAQREIRRVAREVGEERFRTMLGRWVLEGFDPEAGR